MRNSSSICMHFLKEALPFIVMAMLMAIAILLLLMKNKKKKKKMMMMGIGQKWTRSRTYPRCRSHVTTNPDFFFIAVACTLNIKPEKLARQWKFCEVWEVKDLRFRGGMHYQALPLARTSNTQTTSTRTTVTTITLTETTLTSTTVTSTTATGH